MQADADPLIDLAFKKHADDLRGSWQARVLSGGFTIEGNGILRPTALIGAAVLSVIAHNFDEALPVLLRIVYPGFIGIGTPMLCSAAKIGKTGHVMADFISRNGVKFPRQGIFRNEREMEAAFRKLADAAKLTDDERVELFDAVKRWVVCDYRLDPSMDSKDPDAKRLVH